MATPKREKQEVGVFPSHCKSNLVPIVRYIQPYFVETDAANFKAVVQSLTGHHDIALQSLEFLDNVNANVDVVPPHTTSHALHEIDNIYSEEVEILEEMAFGVENITSTPMSFVGFETETFDSFCGDLLFENHKFCDAFGLSPLNILDQEMLWDSFVWPD